MPENTTDNFFHTLEIKLRPCRSLTPALKYSLLVPLGEQEEGNAAINYYRCCLLFEEVLKNRKSKKHYKSIEKWNDLERRPKLTKKLRQGLDQYNEIYHELRLATHKSYCHWQIFGDNPVEYHSFDHSMRGMFPEMEVFRNLIQLIEVKAEAFITEQNFDEAMKLLQMGYTMVHHLDLQPYCINKLVAIGLLNILNGQLCRLMEVADSPDLYWMLTTAARPLIDFRMAVRNEKDWIYFAFPKLKHTTVDQLSAEQWKEELKEFIKVAIDFDIVEEEEFNYQTAIAQANKAISGLAKFGYSKEEIAKMPAAQAVVIYSKHLFEELYDDYLKYLFLPYAEHCKRVDEATERLQKESQEREIIPLASGFVGELNMLPALSARHLRDMDFLRIIAAIRSHATNHQGRLPAKLSDIKDLPIPINEMTGKPFCYQLKKEEAILEATSKKDYPGVRYHIRFEK